MNKYEIKYAVNEVANNGKSALNCPVASKAKTIEVKSAREAPAKSAAIPTKAAKVTVTPEFGKQKIINIPNKDPKAPPMVSNGAKVPPEVPLPNEIAQEVNFNKNNDAKTGNANEPVSKSMML